MHFVQNDGFELVLGRCVYAKISHEPFTLLGALPGSELF